MKTLHKNPDLIVRELDDELVILNPQTGFIHILNSTGKVIWHLLDELDTVDDIVAALIELYTTNNLLSIKADVHEIINDMNLKGIVHSK